MESLGQLAQALYRGRVSRKAFIFSLVIFAIGIVLLSFLSTYLDKNHFRAHAHSDIAEFVSVLLYLLCIMVWALVCFGLVTWFMAKTAFRFNDIGLPGWALAVACYVCSVLNNYSPGPVARWLPLFSLAGMICALLLPPDGLRRKPDGNADD
ncbi:DUF805 domain-containing protein [Serratia sp. FDAARGOS_506]|uniref:DUF805 domain-containing protein n=1 Tax=Serratia sp. FDAARGOS_506 TaxID=2420306 RepID=UPI000F508EB9|nr:DUF805 domain-containing protein [Serratia sp. FDAARGOS_506]AYZ29696.1 DUF805 domain-containing protein [Serratia sp. FDAARGOS_506]HAT4985135.1 DUF805 domain-containing protein [Serratia marcescens]HAT5031610.1 DUF805 domain-containing protein [Serratia marcescens]